MKDNFKTTTDKYCLNVLRSFFSFISPVFCQKGISCFSMNIRPKYHSKFDGFRLNEKSISLFVESILSIPIRIAWK